MPLIHIHEEKLVTKPFITLSPKYRLYWQIKKIHVMNQLAGWSDGPPQSRACWLYAGMTEPPGPIVSLSITVKDGLFSKPHSFKKYNALQITFNIVSIWIISPKCDTNCLNCQTAANFSHFKATLLFDPTACIQPLIIMNINYHDHRPSDKLASCRWLEPSNLLRMRRPLLE